MALFTDTITLYSKVSDTEWSRTVVTGVQWSDKTEKKNDNGKISVVRYAQVTFPGDVGKDLHLDSSRTEDCIVCGIVDDEITGQKGSRISDLMKKYPKSGLIKSVNDNSNRAFLHHMKVVIA